MASAARRRQLQASGSNHAGRYSGHATQGTGHGGYIGKLGVQHGQRQHGNKAADVADHSAALSAEERRRNLPGSEFRITVEEPRKPAAPSAAVPPAAVAAASAPASSSEAPSSLKKAMQRMYGDNWAKGSGASGAAKLAN
eukprot:gene40845-49819_t